MTSTIAKMDVRMQIPKEVAFYKKVNGLGLTLVATVGGRESGRTSSGWLAPRLLMLGERGGEGADQQGRAEGFGQKAHTARFDELFDLAR